MINHYAKKYNSNDGKSARKLALFAYSRIFE